MVRSLVLLFAIFGSNAEERPAGFTLKTELGLISLTFLHDAAPRTAAFFADNIRTKEYSRGTSHFYRSDYVIQFGVRNEECPFKVIEVNEVNLPTVVTNSRGTVALAHSNVPDNGCSETYINIQDNPRLDNVYGGYAPFAKVEDDDAQSFKVIDNIAKAIKKQPHKKVMIREVALRFNETCVDDEASSVPGTSNTPSGPSTPSIWMGNGFFGRLRWVVRTSMGLR